MQIKLDLFAANKLLSGEIKDDTDKVILCGVAL